MTIVNQSQVNQLLNEQGLKHFTFEVSANYSNDLASMYYSDFEDEWENKSIHGDHFIVLFASEEIANKPYYKKSHLARMKKDDLYALCESFEYYSVGEDSLKKDCIDFLLEITNEQFYTHYVENTSFRDFDYTFKITGHCQGDVKLIKLVGSGKDFLENSYLPNRVGLENLFYNSPIDGLITVSCNGEEVETINFNEISGFDEYGTWDKSEFINNLKNTDNLKDLVYLSQLVEFLESNLKESLDYDY